MNLVGTTQNRFSFYSLMVSIFIFFSFFIATPAHAATIQELQTLLIQLQMQLATLQNKTNANVPCVQLSSNMVQGSTEATTGGQVGKLQQFLRIGNFYTYPTLTGYYGPVTLQAVGKWQLQNNVVLPSLGVETYGSVGQITRAAMARGCEGVAQTTSSVEVLSNTPTGPITLGSITRGEDVLDIKVDAGSAVALSTVTVNIAIPFVKAGSWEDMISQIILVSDDAQRSIKASIVDNNRIVSLLGENHDEVTATFEIPANMHKDFSVLGGEDGVFRVVVDFKSVIEAGAFGVKTNSSSGYIRASLADVVDSNQHMIAIKNSPYGPHRQISSSF